eukprot:864449-Prorocentrum_minimum.AAC.1
MELGPSRAATKRQAATRTLPPHPPSPRRPHPISVRHAIGTHRPLGNAPTVRRTLHTVACARARVGTRDTNPGKVPGGSSPGGTRGHFGGWAGRVYLVEDAGGWAGR